MTYSRVINFKFIKLGYNPKVMKYSILIISFFISSLCSGQEIYFSPLTENLQTGNKESVNRTITIGQGQIIIKTEMNVGYDIQELKILEKKLNQETSPPILIYDCTSPDGVYPTLIFIPQRKIITEILAIQPSLVDGSDEHFRFHIETKENLSQ